MVLRTKSFRDGCIMVYGSYYSIKVQFYGSAIDRNSSETSSNIPDGPKFWHCIHWVIEHPVISVDVFVLPEDQGFLLCATSHLGIHYTWCPLNALPDNISTGTFIEYRHDDPDNTALPEMGTVKFLEEAPRAVVSINGNLYLSSAVDSYGCLFNPWEAQIIQMADFGKPMIAIDQYTPYFINELIPLSVVEDILAIAIVNKSLNSGGYSMRWGEINIRCLDVATTQSKISVNILWHVTFYDPITSFCKVPSSTGKSAVMLGQRGEISIFSRDGVQVKSSIHQDVSISALHILDAPALKSHASADRDIQFHVVLSTENGAIFAYTTNLVISYVDQSWSITCTPAVVVAVPLCDIELDFPAKPFNNLVIPFCDTIVRLPHHETHFTCGVWVGHHIEFGIQAFALRYTSRSHGLVDVDNSMQLFIPTCVNSLSPIDHLHNFECMEHYVSEPGTKSSDIVVASGYQNRDLSVVSKLRNGLAFDITSSAKIELPDLAAVSISALKFFQVRFSSHIYYGKDSLVGNSSSSVGGSSSSSSSSSSGSGSHGKGSRGRGSGGDGQPPRTACGLLLSHRTSNQTSFLGFFRDGKQISENEFFCHVQIIDDERTLAVLDCSVSGGATATVQVTASRLQLLSVNEQPIFPSSSYASSVTIDKILSTSAIIRQAPTHRIDFAVSGGSQLVLGLGSCVAILQIVPLGETYSFKLMDAFSCENALASLSATPWGAGVVIAATFWDSSVSNIYFHKQGKTEPKANLDVEQKVVLKHSLVFPLSVDALCLVYGSIEGHIVAATVRVPRDGTSWTISKLPDIKCRCFVEDIVVLHASECEYTLLLCGTGKDSVSHVVARKWLIGSSSPSSIRVPLDHVTDDVIPVITPLGITMASMTINKSTSGTREHQRKFIWLQDQRESTATASINLCFGDLSSDCKFRVQSFVYVAGSVKSISVDPWGHNHAILELTSTAESLRNNESIVILSLPSLDCLWTSKFHVSGLTVRAAFFGLDPFLTHHQGRGVPSDSHCFCLLYEKNVSDSNARTDHASIFSIAPHSSHGVKHQIDERKVSKLAHCQLLETAVTTSSVGIKYTLLSDGAAVVNSDILAVIQWQTAIAPDGRKYLDLQKTCSMDRFWPEANAPITLTMLPRGLHDLLFLSLLKKGIEVLQFVRPRGDLDRPHIQRLRSIVMEDALIQCLMPIRIIGKCPFGDRSAGSQVETQTTPTDTTVSATIVKSRSRSQIELFCIDRLKQEALRLLPSIADDTSALDSISSIEVESMSAPLSIHRLTCGDVSPAIILHCVQTKDSVVGFDYNFQSHQFRGEAIATSSNNVTSSMN